MRGRTHCCPRDEVDGLLGAKADVLVSLDDAVDAGGRDRGLRHFSAPWICFASWRGVECYRACRRELLRLDAMRRDDKSGRSGENAEGRLGATEGVLDLIRTGPGWLWAESYAWRGRETDVDSLTLCHHDDDTRSSKVAQDRCKGSRIVSSHSAVPSTRKQLDLRGGGSRPRPTLAQSADQPKCCCSRAGTRTMDNLSTRAHTSHSMEAGRR